MHFLQHILRTLIRQCGALSVRAPLNAPQGFGVLDGLLITYRTLSLSRILAYSLPPTQTQCQFDGEQIGQQMQLTYHALRYAVAFIRHQLSMYFVIFWVPSTTASMFLHNISAGSTHKYAHDIQNTFATDTTLAYPHIYVYLSISLSLYIYISIYITRIIHLPLYIHLCLSLSLYIYIYIHTSLSLYIYIYVHIHTYIYTYTSIHYMPPLPAYPHVHTPCRRQVLSRQWPPIYLSIYLSLSIYIYIIYIYIYLSIHLSIYLSYLSIYLSIYSTDLSIHLSILCLDSIGKCCQGSGRLAQLGRAGLPCRAPRLASCSARGLALGDQL